MKIETTATGRVKVKIPEGITLWVPGMGTTPGTMTINVAAATEGEVLRKLEQFYDNVARAVFEASQ